MKKKKEKYFCVEIRFVGQMRYRVKATDKEDAIDKVYAGKGDYINDYPVDYLSRELCNVYEGVDETERKVIHLPRR